MVQAPIDLSFLRTAAVRRRIVIVTAAFAIAGALYAFLSPKWYRSVLTVVPARSQKSSGLSAMLGGEISGLAAGFADGAMGVGADAQRIAAVVQSVAVSDALIKKFDLRARYDAEYQESAREALWKHCDVKVLPKPGLVQVSCEDRDPRFAMQMLEFLADYGNQVFRRVGVSSATEQVRFLEKRVTELRAQADESAARMREFQEKHQIVDLDSQTKAVVGAIASLNSQRITKQLELEYARTFSSVDESTARQLESQIAVVDQKLRAMEAETSAEQAAREPRSRRNAQPGMFPAALSVPKLRAEFEQLFRDRKVTEATLVFALERLESARADEARDTSTFLILDPPTLPTRHARPRRMTSILGAFALGLLLSCAFELVAERQRRAQVAASVRSSAGRAA